MKLIGEDDYGDDEDVFLGGKVGYERSDSVEVGLLFFYYQDLILLFN